LLGFKYYVVLFLNAQLAPLHAGQPTTNTTACGGLLLLLLRCSPSAIEASLQCGNDCVIALLLLLLLLVCS
jgi:hypothetical protein